MALSQAQFDTILQRYEVTRLKNQHILNDRRDYVYKNVEGYKELDDSVVSVSMDMARKKMAGDKDAMEELRALLADLKSMKHSLLKGAGLPEQSNIKEFLEDNNFSKLDYTYHTGEGFEAFKRAVFVSRELVEKIDFEHKNILFYGSVGTGKSFLSGCIAKDVLDSGHSVIYFSAVSLFEALARETFDNKAKEDLYNFHEYIYNCDLLIVDDLGTEVSNTFVSNQLFSFINERNLRKKSTIISTNLSLEQISDRYSDRVFSRIINTYTACKLSGADIRIVKRKC